MAMQSELATHISGYQQATGPLTIENDKTTSSFWQKTSGVDASNVT